MDLNKPIQNLEDAKNFYCFMGCNPFHMSREYPERYKEFEALNISKETKAEWQKEKMQQIFKLAVKNRRKDNSLLLEAYFEFSDNFTPDDVKRVYHLLKASYRHSSPLHNVVVAETICNTRGAFPLGCLSLTRKFKMRGWFERYHRLVKKMLVFACERDGSLLERSKRALSPKQNGTAELVKEIKEHLDALEMKYSE